MAVLVHGHEIQSDDSIRKLREQFIDALEMYMPPAERLELLGMTIDQKKRNRVASSLTAREMDCYDKLAPIAEAMETALIRIDMMGQ